MPLGRIVGTHGLRGELRVRAGDDDLANLMRVPRVRLAREGDGEDGALREYDVASAREGRAGECRLTLAGVGDREAAEALRGLRLLARPEDLPPLEPGEFYAYELVGCAVEELDGRPVGVVRSILETGGRDVLVIEDACGGEQLVPAAEPLVQRIDLAERRIAIDAPPGLLEGDRAADSDRPERERQEPRPIRVDVLTIFPALFEPFLRESMVGIAIREGHAEIAVHDLRDWTQDRHRVVDDAPYGGGPGMVMKPEPLVRAIEALAGPKGPSRAAHVVLMSPQGVRLDQAKLAELVRRPRLVLVCGRYEGVDQRAIDLAVDEEISLGDYVLSGGEVPAMALVEGLVRLRPGVLGNPESARSESFQAGLLEGPQYTRPASFRGLEVPEVLRSGDHGAVERWRAERAREATRRRRPDLLDAPPHEEPDESDESDAIDEIESDRAR